MTRLFGAIFVLSALTMLLVAVVAAEETVVRSKNTQVNLLELYTSEGCSSCPPADRWIKRFADDKNLWEDIVPMAFHVDYWDYLGWRDRFASPDHANRQREYAAGWRSDTIYTPGFVLNGHDFGGWRNGSVTNELGEEVVGVLKVTYDGGAASVVFEPEHDGWEALDAHVVLLGFGLASDVTAGENSGKKLHHDFVVLTYNNGVLRRADNYRAPIELKTDHDTTPSRLAIAAWVSASKDPKPIQAVGGWIKQ